MLVQQNLRVDKYVQFFGKEMLIYNEVGQFKEQKVKSQVCSEF